jgi:hypothetical protein
MLEMMKSRFLSLDEHGFGDHGTGAVGTGQSGDGRQQMEKENGQIAHGPILFKIATARITQEFRIRHAQGPALGEPGTIGGSYGRVAALKPQHVCPIPNGPTFCRFVCLMKEFPAHS